MIDSYTKLLLHGNGADGSTVIVDSSPTNEEFLDQTKTGGGEGTALGYGGYEYLGQGFTAAVSGKCTKLSAYLKTGAGSPSGNITCYLYSNNAGKPGTLLSTLSSINANTLTGSKAWYDFTIAAGSAYSLVAGTVYHMVLGFPDGDDSNYAKWSTGPGNPYSGGYENYTSDPASWSSLIDYDLDFKQYYTGTKKVTAVGNAQLDTAQKKFGTASILLDGT